MNVLEERLDPKISFEERRERDPTSRTRNSQEPKGGYWDHRVKRGGGGKKGRREERKFWMKPMIGLQWISPARLVRLVGSICGRLYRVNVTVSSARPLHP